MVVTGLVFIGIVTICLLFWMVIVADCRYLGVPGVRWIYDRAARVWSLDESSSRLAARAAQNSSLEPLLRRALEGKQGARALDVATGTGRVALLASEIIAPDGRVVGVDISRNMLARGRAIVKSRGLEDTVELIEGDAGNLLFAHGSFDLVTCVDAPLPDVRRTLEQMARVLAAGGHLIYTKQSDRWGYLTPGKAPRSSKVLEILQRCGMEDISVEPWGKKGQIFFATKASSAGNGSRKIELLAKVREPATGQ